MRKRETIFEIESDKTDTPNIRENTYIVCSIICKMVKGKFRNFYAQSLNGACGRTRNSRSHFFDKYKKVT